MPRRFHSHAPGAVYHVTLRGAYLRDVYFKPEDRGLLIEILSEVIVRFAGRLHCYSNAPDTLQLLIQVGEEPLGRMLLRVARRYAYSVHQHLHGLMPGLPDASEVVNRLFEIRVRSAALAQVQPVDVSFGNRVRSSQSASA